MYETPRQRVCKWLLLAVLVFSTLDAALFALFDYRNGAARPAVPEFVL